MTSVRILLKDDGVAERALASWRPAAEPSHLGPAISGHKPSRSIAPDLRSVGLGVARVADQVIICYHVSMEYGMKGASRDGLYEQLARIGKVVVHPKRIELLELRSAGRNARCLEDGMPEWRQAGLPVAARINVELGTGFVGRAADELDFAVEVDRARQLEAIACHASQSTDNAVLWRRLELLGTSEHLRWLTPRPRDHATWRQRPGAALLAHEPDVGQPGTAEPGPPGPYPSPASSRRSGTAAPLGMLGLLGVQFLLGMAVNLYVKLPSAGGGMAEMMRSGPLVVTHMMLGMLLAAGALLAVVLALPYGRRAVACAAVALGGILVAGLGGLLFLMDGQSNGASYLMAVGFLVAIAGYVAEIVEAR